MLEIRYRLTAPGVPIPFAGWFDRVPDGRVHGTGMRLHADGGSARYVVMAGADTERLAEDVLAMPAPNAHVWERAGGKHGLAFIRAEWREPIYPFVCSPMRTAWGIHGDSAVLCCTIRRESVVQRILVPNQANVDRLWPDLRDDMYRFAGFTGSPIRLELERVGPIAWTQEAPLEKWPASFRPAFDVGRLDDPPASSLEEVARLVGLPERAVLAELGELEL